MILLATTRPEPVACAFGAYLVAEGTRLRCGDLYVQRGNKRRVLTLRNPETKERIRVRLPKEAIGAKGHAKFNRIELEIL